MQRINCRKLVGVAGVLAALVAQNAGAFTFETGDVRISLDSSVSAGTGLRLKSPSCGLVTTGATGDGAPQGCLAPTSGVGDQGNLNYARGDAFTSYLKGNHELLVSMPEDISMMARVNWLRDFSATHTTGILSATTPTGLTSDGLTDDARDDLRFKARLLDLWVSKRFSVGDQQVRVRAGNQVISWGESLFMIGGINSTNAIDTMRLSQPGAQIKEAVLPAPIVSVAAGLGHGLNAEAYVQTRWNKSYIAPVGGYWSVGNVIGKGSEAYGFPEVDARDSGQWGMSLRWQPRGSEVNYGFYAMNYHDKLPALKIDQTSFAPSWVYPEDRRLYGISANFPLGDWAVGTELSYRPKDAVSLSPLAGCTERDGRCWVDEKRWQWHLTGIYSFAPSNARGLLDALGASSGTLLAEAAVTHYPKLKPAYGGDPLSSAYLGWGQETDPSGAPASAGTRTSAGLAMEFSLNYDGTLIEGWQVIPAVYHFRALSGRTPNVTGMYMKGANSTNLSVSFIRNPATWQFTVNYARFSGGRSTLDQPLGDRDFVGAVLTRNF